jgi:hypothetical protein
MDLRLQAPRITGVRQCVRIAQGGSRGKIGNLLDQRPHGLGYLVSRIAEADHGFTQTTPESEHQFAQRGIGLRFYLRACALLMGFQLHFKAFCLLLLLFKFQLLPVDFLLAVADENRGSDRKNAEYPDSPPPALAAFLREGAAQVGFALPYRSLCRELAPPVAACDEKRTSAGCPTGRYGIAFCLAAPRCRQH